MVDPVASAPVMRKAATPKAAAGPPQSEQLGSSAKNVSHTLPKLVALAEDLTRQGPPIDFAKIAAIRQAIATGTYAIDFDATAAAILAFGRSGKGDE